MRLSFPISSSIGHCYKFNITCMVWDETSHDQQTVDDQHRALGCQRPTFVHVHFL